MRSARAATVAIAGVVWGGEAGAVDIFELEPSSLQRRLDEAWSYSVESRARRGGVHDTRLDRGEADGDPSHAIFAMSLLTEVGPEYTGFHLAASMLDLSGPDWDAIGHGPFFGYSRFDSTSSQDGALGALLHPDEGEADIDHLFAGWSFGIRDAFVELGWRWRWESVDAASLGRLSASRALPYAGRPEEATRHGPFAKLRVGGVAYALRTFLEPGAAWSEPRHVYVEPSYRFAFGEDMALTSELSYKEVRLTDDTPRARFALTETLQFGRKRAVAADGDVWHDRVQVRVALENLWSPDAQDVGETLGAVENYVVRAETEPYYVGAWYNERLGFGWGLGLAGTSEWEKNGQTMRVVLRYMRNYIFTEPTSDPAVPWLVEFSGVVGW